MSRNETSRVAKALVLRNALIGDAESMTDSEIRDEISGLGQDPEKVASDLRAMAMALVTETRKARLNQAAQRLRQQPEPTDSFVGRSVEAIRRRLAALAANPESMAGKKVALAFRNGERQSDSDVLSLWQDLVDLGAVRDDEP